MGRDDRKTDAQAAPVDGQTRLAAVFSEAYRDVFAFVRGKVGSGPPDPDDIVQQAFANFAAMDDRSGVKNPTAFLVRIAGNLITDHARKSATRLNVSVNGDELDFIVGDRDEISPEIVVLGRERLALVVAALERLPRRQRRFVLLNRLKGKSIADIALHNGVSQSTARREIEAGLEFCRQALAELMNDDA